jgi:hypothetical protein
MGAHVLLLHAVQAFQRRLVASYKRQLGWDDGREEGPGDPAPQTNRRPIFTLLALTAALTAAGVSVSLYSGAPSGFEGWGSMVVGAVVGLLGAPVALILCFVALVREKKYLWLNLVSIAVCLLTLLWLFSQN